MTPSAIMQEYLDQVAGHVMAGRFEDYRDSVALPFHLVTASENLVLRTEGDLRASFDGFRDLLRLHRVTDYIRLVESCQQLDQGLIAGRYVTHLISGGTRIAETFHSQVTLRLVGNSWRAASISNALANSRWPFLIPGPGASDTQKGPQE
jgi:hypothetical protein